MSEKAPQLNIEDEGESPTQLEEYLATHGSRTILHEPDGKVRVIAKIQGYRVETQFDQRGVPLSSLFSPQPPKAIADVIHAEMEEIGREIQRDGENEKK